MRMCVVYGVKTDDMEIARAWVEQATGVTGEGRESAALGGDYYLFKHEEEELRLISNRDFDDYEPIFTESDEWPLAMRLEDAKTDSPLLRGLEGAADHFVKLQEKTY